MLYIKNMEDISEIIKKDSKKNLFYNFIHWQNNKFLNKIILLYKYLFNIVTIRNFGDKQIYIIPWKEEKNKKIKYKKFAKILKKINLKNSNNVFLALSNAINEEERILEIVYKNRLKVLDGRWLFSILMQDTAKYISDCQNKNLNEQAVAILINNPNEIAMSNIINIAGEVKNIKIVTTNNKYFRRIENKLYEEMGIPIIIANNKKKSLLNSDIIINVDFSEKEINQYNLNKKSIIININDNIHIKSKAFSGINASWYKIKISNEYEDLFKEYNLYNQFDVNILYESLIYSRDKFEKLKNTIEKDKVKIDYLVGIKGKINEIEYLKSVGAANGRP